MNYRICALAVVILAGVAHSQSLPPPSQLATNQSSEKAVFFSGEVKLDDSSPPPSRLPSTGYAMANLILKP